MIQYWLRIIFIVVNWDYNFFPCKNVLQRFKQMFFIESWRMIEIEESFVSFCLFRSV